MSPEADRALPSVSLSALLRVALLAALVLPLGAPRAGAQPVHSAGPTLAVEDTMHTDVSEVLVRAPRVTLDEILDRVARGEARRDSLLQDQSFTATLRVMRNVTGTKAPELFFESVSKVYKKKPNKIRTIELRNYEAKPDKKGKSEDEDKKHDDTVDADFSPGMGEEMVNFAFRPENRRNFKFRIEDRKILGDHLLYTLRFEPRSALAVYEPAGRVWVDTKDFVIVRQELEFRQSPVPLFLKGIRHMVVERTYADGFWVMSRMMMRIELTLPLPKFGNAFDFAMAMSDYKVNSSLPDSMFATPASNKNVVRLKVGGGRGRKS